MKEDTKKLKYNDKIKKIKKIKNTQKYTKIYEHTNIHIHTPTKKREKKEVEKGCCIFLIDWLYFREPDVRLKEQFSLNLVVNASQSLSVTGRISWIRLRSFLISSLE